MSRTNRLSVTADNFGVETRREADETVHLIAAGAQSGAEEVPRLGACGDGAGAASPEREGCVVRDRGAEGDIREASATDRMSDVRAGSRARRRPIKPGRAARANMRAVSAGACPLTAAEVRPDLSGDQAKVLGVLLERMHTLSRKDGFAPSRTEFYRGAGLAHLTHKKFFASYGALVQVCGFRMAAERLIRLRQPAVARPGRTRNGRRVESVFGARLTGCEMEHAPTNEQGVVMLFGMMAKELGFVIELVRTGYPDCEAKRRGENGEWRRVLIEFEFLSGNFDHDPAGCDLVVCWRDNARRNEVEVLELKSEMEKRGMLAGSA